MKSNYTYDSDYFQRTYAGWLGKIIGIRLGSPIEGWSYKKIQETYGEISDYLVDYQDYAADDDSNGPNFFIRALIDFADLGSSITEKEMGETWLNYVPYHHGFFWWGGYGISTEHMAYENLKAGISAPRSGSIEQNGKLCAEQIGGQIFIDPWGFINPGDPETAAEYAAKMIRVSHDGEALYGGMFITACISAAYIENSIDAIITSGLRVIPEDCEYALLVKDIRRFYTEDKNKDWHDCFAYVKENYGYDKYQGNCHIIPNAAVIILSLLYGNEDFSETQYICNMCGWDTDCNAGNVGAIMGVFTGIDGIEDKWIEPIKDLLLSSSVIGGLNIATVANTAELFCTLGYQVSGKPVPELWNERITTGKQMFHFDLKKSTQAIRISGHEDAIAENSEKAVIEGHRSLLVSTPDCDPANPLRVFMKTYYGPEDLHDSRYDPSFTPILFPGQTVEALVRNVSGQELRVRLFAYDSNNHIEYFSEPVILSHETEQLSFTIPSFEGGLIRSTGLEILPTTPHKPANLLIDHIAFSGVPNYTINFSKESIQHYGYANGHIHKEISQFSYDNGYWELDGRYLSGSCNTEAEAYSGKYHAENYKLSAVINPQIGSHHLLNFRVQGAARSYAIGFFGKNTIALVKKHISYKVLKKIDFSYNMHQDYTITVSVVDNTFTINLDGKPVMTYTDEHDPYMYGQFGCTVLYGSHCHYRDISFSSYPKQH